MKKIYKNKDQIIRYMKVAWITAFLITILFMTLSPLIGSIHFFFDLFSHYQIQYFAAILFLIPIGYLIKIDKYLLISALVVLVGHFFLLLYPIVLIPASEFPSKPELFFMNTNYYLTDNSETLVKIDEIQPETVAIVEANSDIINSLTEIYGPPATVNGEGALKCALFTKEDFEILPITDAVLDYPVCAAQIDGVKMIVIHPTPPLSEYFFTMQKNYFEDINNYLESLGDSDYILMGDFNSTSFNSIFRQNFGKIHKVNNYSWEVRRPYMLPIDHVMGNFEIQLYKTEQLSSDHVGIVADY